MASRICARAPLAFPSVWAAQGRSTGLKTSRRRAGAHPTHLWRGGNQSSHVAQCFVTSASLHVRCSCRRVAKNKGHLPTPACHPVQSGVTPRSPHAMPRTRKPETGHSKGETGQSGPYPPLVHFQFRSLLKVAGASRCSTKTNTVTSGYTGKEGSSVFLKHSG